MKIFYRICAVFSFCVLVVILACVSVFLFADLRQPIHSEKTYLQIDDYEIERIEIGDSLSFYCTSFRDCNKNTAIALGYTLYDQEERHFQFLLEDPKTYFQVVVNEQEYIACQVVQK